jgi:hypothetical protein
MHAILCSSSRIGLVLDEQLRVHLAIDEADRTWVDRERFSNFMYVLALNHWCGTTHGSMPNTGS